MVELHSGRVFPAVVGVFSIAVRIRQKIGKIVEIRHCLVCPCPVYPQNWSIIRLPCLYVTLTAMVENTNNGINPSLWILED
jgi:hypothetical protein